MSSLIINQSKDYKMKKPEYYFMLPSDFSYAGRNYKRMLSSEYGNVVIYSWKTISPEIHDKIGFEVFVVHRERREISGYGSYAIVDRYPNYSEWGEDAFKFKDKELLLAVKKFKALRSERATLFDHRIEGVKTLDLDQKYMETHLQLLAEEELEQAAIRDRMGRGIKYTRRRGRLFD